MSPAPGAERLRAVLDTNIYVGAFAYPKVELEAYEEIPIISGRDFRRTLGLR
jgi:hypothetical protein